MNHTISIKNKLSFQSSKHMVTKQWRRNRHLINIRPDFRQFDVEPGQLKEEKKSQVNMAKESGEVKNETLRRYK